MPGDPPPQGKEPVSRAARCVWCESVYLPPYSRARTASLFCSAKCEVEARFWLVTNLDARTE